MAKSFKDESCKHLIYQVITTLFNAELTKLLHLFFHVKPIYGFRYPVTNAQTAEANILFREVCHFARLVNKGGWFKPRGTH